MKALELSDDEIELAHTLASDAVFQAKQRVKECEQDGFDTALVGRKRELATCKALLAKLEEAIGD